MTFLRLAFQSLPSKSPTSSFFGQFKPEPYRNGDSGGTQTVVSLNKVTVAKTQESQTYSEIKV